MTIFVVGRVQGDLIQPLAVLGGAEAGASPQHSSAAPSSEPEGSPEAAPPPEPTAPTGPATDGRRPVPGDFQRGLEDGLAGRIPEQNANSLYWRGHFIGARPVTNPPARRGRRKRILLPPAERPPGPPR